jgi:hypothetical protein
MDGITRVQDMQAWATALGEVLPEYFAHHVQPLLARIDALEKAAAAGPNLADVFKGTWMPGTVYSRGSLSVWDGCLWLSLVDSNQKPGTTADWKMITKKGRDGKDLRP